MQFSERLTCTIKEAADATGISRSKLYVLMDEGKIETTKPYSRRLIVVPSLLALLAPSRLTARAMLDQVQHD